MNILDVVLNLIIAGVICVLFEIFHELLHILRAKQLGYKISSFSIKNAEVVVDVKNESDNIKIARFPYLIILPVSILMLYIGYSYSIDFLTWSSIMIVIFHIISYKLEGREV